MEKTASNGDRNRFTGFIFILISVLLLILSIKLYHSESSFFQSFDTIRFSGHFLTYDAPDVNRLIMDNLKDLLWKFSKGYIIPFFLVLIPGIFLMAMGLNKITGKEIELLKFLQDKKKERNFLAVVFVFCFISVVLIHFFVLLDYPLASDEFSYLFQSEIMATGKVRSEAPPFSESLTGDNIVVNNGKWYSKYTIGWPLLLVPGKLVGIPWVVNALLASASLLLLYLISKQIFGKTAGVISIFIAILSPYFLLQAATFFPHTSSGFFALLLVFSFLKLRDESKWKYSFIAGLAIAMLLLIRPADGGIICIGLFPWVLCIIIKSQNRRDTILKLTPILGGFITGIASLMLVNYIQNDNPLMFSFVKNKADELWGFGNIRHTPVKGLWNIIYSTLRSAFWVFPFIAAGSLLSFMRKKSESFFLIFMAMGFPAFYFFYYSLGVVEFGSRYYFPGFVLLIPLAAGGVEGFFSFIKQKSEKYGQNLIPAFLIMTTAFMATGVLPRLLSSVRFGYQSNRKFIKWLENPMPSEQKIISFIKNVPEAKADIFVRNQINYRNQKNISAIWFLPEENRKLIDAFPDRTPYVITFDYGKNNFIINPYPEKDNADASDYLFAAVNYEACVSNIDKAVEILKETNKHFPENPAGEYSLGVLLFKHDRYEEAAEVLTKLTQHRQDHADAFYFSGRSLGNIGKRAEALNTLELFIKKFPNSPRVQRAKEWIQYYSKQTPVK